MIEVLFSSEVKTCCGSIADFTGKLYPSEEACVDKAVRKRKREFVAGRVCARRALAEIGAPEVPLPANQDRTPAWPEGFTGTISHSDDICGAAVARTHAIAGLVLDIERISRFDLQLLPFICIGEELRFLNRLGRDERLQAAAIIFSAKECFYKCQYAVTRLWVGFHDVAIRLHPGGNEFRVHVLTAEFPACRAGTRSAGKYICSQDYVFTGMSWPALASLGASLVSRQAS